MFYVSSEKDFEGVTKYGVTDTMDWVEEFYTSEELSSIIRYSQLSIQGAFKCGNSFTFYPIKLNQKLETKDIESSLNCIRRGGSTEGILKASLACSLISAKVGTEIVLSYGMKHTHVLEDGYCTLNKISENSWSFSDSLKNFASGSLSSTKAALYLSTYAKSSNSFNVDVFN